MYLLALLCPPLAILLTGRIFQAILACFLLIFYFPAALLAILVVADYKAQKRTNRIIKAQKQSKVTVATAVVNNVQTNVQVVNEAHTSNDLISEMLFEQQRRDSIARLEFERQRQIEAKRRRNAIVLAIAESPRIAVQAGVSAYHELPEWAQPITWGLAAGTPFAVVAVLLFLRG